MIERIWLIGRIWSAAASGIPRDAALARTRPESGAAARAQRGSCHRTPSCVSHQIGAAGNATKANGYGHLRENRVLNCRLVVC